MVTIRFGFNGAQQRSTCSMSGRPPARCSTLAREDFSRVPLPAARMTMTTSLFGIVRPFSPALVALTIPHSSFRKDLFRSAQGGRNCVIDEPTDFLIHSRHTFSAWFMTSRRRDGLEARHKLPRKPG